MRIECRAVTKCEVNMIGERLVCPSRARLPSLTRVHAALSLIIVEVTRAGMCYDVIIISSTRPSYCELVNAQLIFSARSLTAASASALCSPRYGTPSTCYLHRRHFS
jgi:hypothetical protein